MNHLKTISPYLVLLIFPVYWTVYNLHGILYKAGIVSNEAILWTIYDSGTCLTGIIIAISGIVFKHHWQKILSLWTVSAYYLVTLLSELAGHNTRGNLIDSSIQAVTCIVAIGLVYGAVEWRNREL